MTPGHRFIDAAGGTVVGRDACVAAWRGYVESFPDYRNVFDAVVDAGDGTVVARGRSECCVPELHGPAKWRAEVIDGRVDVWHVTDAEAGSSARAAPVSASGDQRRSLTPPTGIATHTCVVPVC